MYKVGTGDLMWALKSRSSEARGYQHLLNRGCGEGGLAGIQTEEAHLSGRGTIGAG